MPPRFVLPRDLPWTTPYPLPRDTAQALLERGGNSDNFSLLLDRCLAYTAGPQGASLVREYANREGLASDLSPLADLVAANLARWDALAASLGAATLTALPDWRVIVGLGTNTLLEGGMALHRIYGFPIVPSSAVKGMTRLYAEAVVGIPAEESERLFGTVHGADESAQRGDLVFLDAVPAAPPRIERDLANPHFVAYYGGQANTPPAAYLSPRPVFFLTVGRGSPFRFGVASIEGDRASAERAIGWLGSALGEIGLGAKTAAGYGYWTSAGAESAVDAGEAAS